MMSHSVWKTTNNTEKINQFPGRKWKCFNVSLRTKKDFIADSSKNVTWIYPKSRKKPSYFSQMTFCHEFRVNDN